MKAIMTIMVYWSVGNGGMTTATADYESIAACEAARPRVVSALTVEQRKAVAVCTSKG
jgi:hypothetical protein